MTRRRFMLFGVVALAPLMMFVGACGSDEPGDFSSRSDVASEVLIQTTTSWDGGDFEYPDGDSELTVARISLSAGSRIEAHCHTFPLASEVVKGEITITKLNGESRTFGEGEAVVEVFNTWHTAEASEDTELLVFYAAAEDVPLSVLKDSGHELESECSE